MRIPYKYLFICSLFVMYCHICLSVLTIHWAQYRLTMMYTITCYFYCKFNLHDLKTEIIKH